MNLESRIKHTHTLIGLEVEKICSLANQLLKQSNDKEEISWAKKVLRDFKIMKKKLNE